jgi:hypothetical protein
VVVVAVEAVAAAAGEGKNFFRRTPMKTKSYLMTSAKILSVTSAIALAASALAASTDKKESSAAASKQKQFSTPKEAAESLIAAAESFDTAALIEILGPEGEDLVSSSDPVADKNRATAFAAKAKEKMVIEKDKGNPNRAIVAVGNDDFPLPIPIDKQHGKWVFNTKVGHEEVINRRVGENELDAIAICRGFVDAQHEYALQKHDDSIVNQYAQKIISTPGKHDGLSWKNADGTWGGPVGEGVAKAIEQGYSKKDQPYHGYFFKVLKGQGPAAPLGEMDFVVNGAMIGGFALAASPAEYRVTGVKSFIVGPKGIVYEKDLGKDTLKAFEELDKFNPDKSWKATNDDWGDDEGDQQPDQPQQ